MSTSKIEFAKYFATTEHVIKRNQTYNNLPYTHHLQQVVDILKEFGMGEEYDEFESYICAAWLHDVLEDCKDVKYRDIVNLFGDEVATLVAALTDSPGKNRKERHANYPMITHTSNCVVIKLADRLANVRNKGHKLQMYKDEYLEFKTVLINSHLGDEFFEEMAEQMWEELDNILLTDVLGRAL